MTTITNAGPPPRAPRSMDSCDDPNCIECPEVDAPAPDRRSANEAFWNYRVDRESTTAPGGRQLLLWGSCIRDPRERARDVAHHAATVTRAAHLTYIGRLHVHVWQVAPIGMYLNPDRVDPTAPVPYYALHFEFEPGTPPLLITTPTTAPAPAITDDPPITADPWSTHVCQECTGS